jgi:hypothetical protein
VYWAAEVCPIFVVFTLFNLSHPGFFLPREYTGLIIKLKAIALAKTEEQWPLTISPPFPMQGPEMLQDDSSSVRLVEVRMDKS